MFCPKCHTELNNNASFCKRCGTEQKKIKKRFHWNQFSSSRTFERMNVNKSINKELEEIFEEEKISKEDHNETNQSQYNYSKIYSNIVKDENDEHKEQYSYSQNYSNASQKYITSDNDYIDAYIGPNAVWIKKQSFSILTAFFGPFYLLYRKLWTQGIILLILYICSYVYLFENLGIVLRVVINIIMAIKFREIYITVVEKRIQQIKTQNADKTSSELLEECKNKGGSWSIGKLFFILCLYFIIVVILLNKEEYTKIVQNETVSTHKEIQDMYYEINESMTEKDIYTNYHHYIDRKENGTCYITITTETTNKTTREYILDEATIYDYYAPKTINDFKIREQDGSYLSQIHGKTQKEYYAIKDKNTIYEIKFEDNNYQYNNCISDKSKIINSINWKE